VKGCVRLHCTECYKAALAWRIKKLFLLVCDELGIPRLVEFLSKVLR
jgi:hypothetical protein